MWEVRHSDLSASALWLFLTLQASWPSAPKNQTNQTSGKELRRVGRALWLFPQFFPTMCMVVCRTILPCPSSCCCVSAALPSFSAGHQPVLLSCWECGSVTGVMAAAGLWEQSRQNLHAWQVHVLLFLLWQIDLVFEKGWRCLAWMFVLLVKPHL